MLRDIDWFYWGAIKRAHVEDVPGAGGMSLEIERLPNGSWLVDEAPLALLQGLLLVLGSNLGIVLEDAPALVTPLNVLTVGTLAILVAGDACLETLAVLF